MIATTPDTLNLPEAVQNLLKLRYLQPNETPDGMFHRVAAAVARAEDNYPASNKNFDIYYRRFYQAMSALDFVPNSPALMNAGTERPSCAACYTLTIEDSIESIFGVLKTASKVVQHGGGIGFNFSKLRPAGSPVKTTTGVSSGPCSFIRNFDMMAETIKQGGKRRAALMALLRVDHPDVLAWIKMKDQDGYLPNFNVSVALTDKFMEAVKNCGYYELIDPQTGKPAGELSATLVWDELVTHAWKNGEPGIAFIDQINKANPVPELGELDCLNACSELPMATYGCCVLGSINLSHMIIQTDKGPQVHSDKIGDIVQLGVRFLDNVIDINEYILPEIQDRSFQDRRIGLGVMGWADMLIQLGIPYDSVEAVHLASQVMSFIYNKANEASIALAHERGAYGGYKEGMPFRRNSTLTTVPPTGSTSIIASASSGIEPLFALSLTRKSFEGLEIVQHNAYFEQALRKLPLDIEKTVRDYAAKHGVIHPEFRDEPWARPFRTAREIAPVWHVRMQAAWQSSIDAAVSKTINMPADATKEQVSEAFMLAYELGCKSITVYRDGSREGQALNAGTVKREPDKETTAPTPSMNYPEGVAIVPRARPTTTFGRTDKVRTGCSSLYVTVNNDEHGVCEVFAKLGKSGGCTAAFTEAVARLASLALRSDIAPAEIIKQLKGIHCPVPALGSCTSCPDGIAKVLEQTIAETVSVKLSVGHCSECHSPLVYEECCAKCMSCGYSRCG